MDSLIADASGIDFFIENQLSQQIGLVALPFPNMNKSGAGVCTFFLNHNCMLKNLCPLRHIKGDRTVVCKHWLRGLCKKGDDCEFLHEYDMSKMPECYFYSKFGECMNKECPFLHIDPESKIQDCAWYDRGFCRNGPSCRNRHVRRVACKNFVNGFCPDGKECKFAHPKWLPLPGSAENENSRSRFVCHYCNERGHKIQFCLKLPVEERQRIIETNRQNANSHLGSSGNAGAGLQVNSSAGNMISNNAANVQSHTNMSQYLPTTQSAMLPPGVYSQHMQQQHQQMQSPFTHSFQGISVDKLRQHTVPSTAASGNMNQHHGTMPHHPPGLGRNANQKPLDEVTCYKCGEKGHYANRCNKGYLAFLSKVSLQPSDMQEN